jgi:hypothetical protein
VSSALDYGSIPGFLDSCFGYFPYAENNDSNPVCVCCKPPLAGYVVLISHDDDPRLMFRSLDGFFHAAIEYVKNGEFLDTHELRTDFEGSERTTQDVTIARQLVALPAGLQGRERAIALDYACELLADENVSEIVALLQDGDEYVRESATLRLKRIPSSAAKTALDQLEGEFDLFVGRCASWLQEAGINASVVAVYGKKAIRIDPGTIWLNTEAFFSERGRADFDEYLVERVKILQVHEQQRKKSHS